MLMAICTKNTFFHCYYCPCIFVDVEAKETVQNTSYAGSFIAIATVACAILVLFGCASFCPRRTNFKVIVWEAAKDDTHFLL